MPRVVVVQRVAPAEHVVLDEEIVEHGDGDVDTGDRAERRELGEELFERDGADLPCTVPIGLTTAALGGTVEVPTLAGKVEIELPEGTQHGKTFRLRGKGIKGVRGSYPGDLYCHITVETPVKLTEHQRKLLKELDESLKKGGAKHAPGGESWTDKLKGFFG